MGSAHGGLNRLRCPFSSSSRRQALNVGPTAVGSLSKREPSELKACLVLLRLF